MCARWCPGTGKTVRARSPIQDRLAGGPLGKAEEVAHRGHVGADHGRVGPAGELPVRGDVVAVCMGVGHHEAVAITRMGVQPSGYQLVDGRTQREQHRVLGRTGVEEQRRVRTEEQVHDRCLIGHP
jgi:hypothetical protein